jgi:hypothetical protein
MGGVRRLDRRAFVSTVAPGPLALAVSGAGTLYQLV